MANRARVLQGHSDFPLNELGRQQARAAGEALRGVAFDHALTSDLSRARETAELIIEAAGEGTLKRGVTLRMEQMLRERKFGNLESECRWFKK